MRNSIEAHLEFSFKGETYSLSSTLDLDQLLEHNHALPSIHALLAAEHGIDTYSYLYEVMLEEPVRFGNAQGMAASFLKEDSFDMAAFAAQWQDSKVLAPLQIIARQELDVTDLNQHPQLRNALLQAYHLGQRRHP